MFLPSLLSKCVLGVESGSGSCPSKITNIESKITFKSQKVLMIHYDVCIRLKV